MIADQHAKNYAIWHKEDLARVPNSPDAIIAGIKRELDRLNQLRNDLIESVDRELLDFLTSQGLPTELAPLHSETPGMMIDRLSILSLKIFHTREEIYRTDGPLGHSDRNRSRLQILEHQRNDLSDCLRVLWDEIMA
ncbi:MAG: DUF4254 domain-containing protein, partial [Chloroflexota bacterium]|nr:DUF4254 domain-containing protein [Chloroflexota bacterium]